MSDSKKKFVAAGVGVLLALAAGWGCSFALTAHGDEEERPPIVVNESSIDFAHGRKWKDHGNRTKWKPDHKGGRNVTEFDVVALNRTAKTVCFVAGEQISIEYTLTNGTKREFKLSLEPDGKKREPVLTSPVPLDDSNHYRLRLAGEGGITRVAAATGDPCPFPANADVQIFVTIK